MNDIIFQAESGYEYTSKLQKMFQDIILSKTLNEDFKKFSRELSPLSRKFHSEIRQKIDYYFNTPFQSISKSKFLQLEVGHTKPQTI